jgi:hypothetical protein
MDHQSSPRTAGKLTTDRQPTDKAGRERDDERSPEPAAVIWTRTQLRERIQRAGAALAPTAQPAERPTHEVDRSPLAGREAEP